MKSLPLILASASPRRRELLSTLGIIPLIVASDAPELHDEHLTAREVCMINSLRKGAAVAARHPDHLILSADTLVYLGTRLFAKPVDSADARQMLRDLSGQTHSVVTAVSLMCRSARFQKAFAETTFVTFRTLNEAQIEDYLSQVHTMDKAGGYAIQEQGDLIIEQIEGSYSNVMGLPVEALQVVLKNGDIPSFEPC